MTDFKLCQRNNVNRRPPFVCSLRSARRLGTRDDGRVSDARTKLTDPRAIRALAHPVRLAILEYLGGVDSATATECAQVTGMSPSATSYHLRELARYGLVSETPGADKRERRWRSSGDFSVGQSGDKDVRDASTLLGRLVLGRADERAAAFLDKAEDEPLEWWDSSMFSESQLSMTPAEARDLTEAVNKLLKPYSRKRRDAPPGARAVQVTFRLFPLPARPDPPVRHGPQS